MEDRARTPSNRRNVSVFVEFRPSGREWSARDRDRWTDRIADRSSVVPVRRASRRSSTYEIASRRLEWKVAITADNTVGEYIRGLCAKGIGPKEGKESGAIRTKYGDEKLRRIAGRRGERSNDATRTKFAVGWRANSCKGKRS